MTTPALPHRLLSIAALCAATCASASPPTPTDQIDALNQVFGRHANVRASHAKGICVSARFTPDSEAPAFVRASLFAEAEVPAIARFSIGGGNPKVSDKSRTVRGLAVRLQGKTENYDLVMISEPAFFAATPEGFVSFLQARVPDPVTKQPNPDRIREHNARFPDGVRQGALLATHGAPVSYATTPYFTNHAFRFTGTTRTPTWARVQLEPAAGTHYLSTVQEADAPDNFLQEELAQRLARNPVSFSIVARPAGKGDSLTDSTLPWRADGPAPVVLGKLQVIALAPAATCDALTFVPTVLPAGVEPSADPILQARAAAYAVALQRRQQ